jgi:hypothetical protein
VLSYFHCYSAQPFANGNNDLNHFCYNAQLFYDFVSHSRDPVMHFAKVFGHFMILSAILEILSVILYNVKPFCKITQSFPCFHQPFFKMTNAGSRGARRLSRGGSGAHGTEPRTGVGGGEGLCGTEAHALLGAPSSVSSVGRTFGSR